MTVCVAVMANVPNYPTVVAATDRAITAANQVFEGSGQSKRYTLTQRIVALGAGDLFDESEIIRRAMQEIEEKKLESVGEVAECVGRAYRAYRKDVYQREFLESRGLTWNDYHKTAKDLPEDFVDRVERGVRDRWLPVSDREFGTSTIVAGVDTVSTPIPDYITAHIYVIKDPGQVLCADSIGFAAVGEGLLQAESYLMLEGYSVDTTFNDATLTVYAAKRSAERAPHVGAKTDLLRVDVTGMGFANDADLKGIERIFQADLERKRKSVQRARVQMTKFMEGLKAQAALPEPEQQVPAHYADGTANGEEALRLGTQEGEPTA